jgi:hypothetical protein
MILTTAARGLNMGKTDEPIILNNVFFQKLGFVKKAFIAARFRIIT